MEYSEFEIQAEVYMQMKAQYPIVRGEYFYEPVDRRTDKFKRIKAHRFDVVVFDAQERILAVIEVKKLKGKHNIEHYKKSVIAPVVLIVGMHEVPVCAERVAKAIREYVPCETLISVANEYMLNASAYARA